MSFVDDLIDKCNDLNRRLSFIERLDVNPPVSSVPKYSGTPVANAIAYWTGAGTIAGDRTIYVSSGGSVSLGTATPGQLLHVYANANSAQRLRIQNVGTSTASQVGFDFVNDAGHGLQGFTTGSNFTPSGQLVSDMGYFQMNSGTLLLRTTGAFPVIFGANSTEYARILSTGEVGIGVSAAAAQLDVLQSTLGSAVQQLASTATNSDPTEIVYQNRVATTDATVTTLHTFTIPASTTYMIVANVVARRTGGSAGTAEDGAGYIVMGVFKNVTGTATSIGSSILGNAAQESQGTWDASFDVTGATARLRVTGAVNNNVVWHMTARVYAVST